MKGELVLVVVFDGVTMKSKALDIGFELEIIMEGHSGYMFTKALDGFDEPFTAIVSGHFAGRLALEFLSLDWFFAMEKSNMELMINEAMELAKPNQSVQSDQPSAGC